MKFMSARLAQMTGWVLRERYVWSWRIRYWWLDTPSGEAAQRVMFLACVLVAIVQVARMGIVGANPPAPGEPAKAVYWWVYQLIALAVSAIISYVLRPKPQTPAPQTEKAPSVEDGQSVKHHFGEVWVEDEFLLAWKQMGTVPIKTKGGKK